jgi:hypothetical protein
MSAGRTVNSLRQDWRTPKNYADSIAEYFGGAISLDPCSAHNSFIEAKTKYILPEHDGLRETWDFPTIFVNPPYGADRERGTTIRDWLRRCALANEEHESEVIALVPIAANTSHWKLYVWPKAKGIVFLYDTRLKFVVEGLEVDKGAPMACSIIYWGDNARAFLEHFRKFGAAVPLDKVLLPAQPGVPRSHLRTDVQGVLEFHGIGR